MEVALTQLTAQREMPMLGSAPTPKKVDGILLSMCNSLLDAIHLCVHLSKLPHYVIAEKLGIDRGHWTRIMQGQAHFPTNKMTDLQSLCGNYAPVQWLARASGFDLFEDAKAKRREELQRELASLEAVA